MIVKKGSAHWEGPIKEGKATVSTGSKALDAQPYGFNTRFEDKPGTNPEELIAAAHASCFSMALSLQLTDAGITDVVIDTEAKVSMDKDGDGFAVKSSQLITKVSATGDAEKIKECAEGAKAGCPISKLLNCDISLDLTIA
ncbi:OsmC family peroxiredoxin [Thioclava sp. SK-1]|uniref:OsmC family protein n=1 Tax=Thioclava sp. SK-1 TaxID=1889770 RepID=UPI000824EA4B|nr:OsmC family protein [Thioclava sp. SK-1]OCX64597.1 OsmC family peroxiredoxin [Thioclava sp. SK-1]